MKPEFVPYAPKGFHDSPEAFHPRIAAIEAHLAAQSQPAEPVGVREMPDRAREAAAAFYKHVFGMMTKLPNETLRERTHAEILSGRWDQDEAVQAFVRFEEQTLRTPAREVSDGEVPGKSVDGQWLPGDIISRHLRKHNMAVVYREGPK